MSRSISLVVKISSNERASARKILEILIELGWNPVTNGLVNYLPIDDNEMFNWTKENITTDQLFVIADLKEQKQEVIGTDLYLENSGIGVTLLIFNSNEIVFNLDINRKYINESIELIDFNWYASKILYGLYENFNIIQYTFEFVY